MTTHGLDMIPQCTLLQGPHPTRPVCRARHKHCVIAVNLEISYLSQMPLTCRFQESTAQVPDLDDPVISPSQGEVPGSVKRDAVDGLTVALDCLNVVHLFVDVSREIHDQLGVSLGAFGTGDPARRGDGISQIRAG